MVTPSLSRTPASGAFWISAQCETNCFHSSGVFGSIYQKVGRNGLAMTACISGLTSVGTGMTLAGVVRGPGWALAAFSLVAIAAKSDAACAGFWSWAAAACDNAMPNRQATKVRKLDTRILPLFLLAMVRCCGTG